MSLGFTRERTFQVQGLTIAAKEWGEPGAMPVIALHGWLDNAASFDLLLPHLSNLHVIALDCAGHGKSSFRSADAGYNIWQDIAEVIEIADQLGWQQFALLGHSRGAIIASLIAGTFPQRITHAALIDGHMPGLGDVRGSAKQMARAIVENRRFADATPSFFDSFEAAAKARASGFVSLQPQAATVLAQRGVRQAKRGFYWHNDQRLKAASQIKLTTGHVEDFHRAIKADVLLILAEDSPFTSASNNEQILSWIENLQLETLQGSHHLHMEEQAPKVAQLIQKFFGQNR